MRFRTRVVVSVAALLSLSFGVGGGLLIAFSHASALEAERARAVASYQMALTTLGVVSGVSESAGYDAVVDTLSQLETGGAQWAALLLKNDYGTIYESGGGAGLDARGTAAAAAGQCVTQIVRDDSGARYLRVSGSLYASDETLTLSVFYDIAQLYARRAAQQAVYDRVFALISLAGAAASYVTAGFLTRPLVRLSRASRRIASGELDCRADASGNDEIGDLARDFNAMADALALKIDELTDAMARREAFMGSFAHEMKTPMTSIIGYADLLRRDSLTGEEARQAANYIFSESRRLENLSLKLLELIVLKKGGFKLTPARPAYIAAQVVRVMKPELAGRGIVLQARCEDGVCLLEPDLVKSLVINLVDNAKKAIDASGNIFIETRMLPEGCLIDVTDNGRGMEADQLDKITEAFYRVDKSRARAQGGAGLGLALCAEIAALHGGAISFKSAVGQGTRVRVELRAGRGNHAPEEA